LHFHSGSEMVARDRLLIRIEGHSDFEF